MKLSLRADLLEKFAQFINEENLTGKKSRLRTRLHKTIVAKIETHIEEYKELVNEHAVKDDKGEVVTDTTENDEQIIPLIDANKFQIELNELMSEEHHFEIDEDTKGVLEEIFFETERTFHNQEALIYDELCTIVENIE